MNKYPRRVVLAVLTGAFVIAPLLTTSATSATSPTSVTAATSSVLLKVKGVGTRHSARFCGKRKRVYVFRRGSMLTYKGLVTPPPAKHFLVDVKVEKCVNRHWRKVDRMQIIGKRATGKFKAVFRAPRPGRAKVTYFRAVAIVAGVRSNKRYFGIHR